MPVFHVMIGCDCNYSHEIEAATPEEALALAHEYGPSSDGNLGGNYAYEIEDTDNPYEIVMNEDGEELLNNSDLREANAEIDSLKKQIEELKKEVQRSEAKLSKAIEGKRGQAASKGKWHRGVAGFYKCSMGGYDCVIEQVVEGDWNISIYKEGAPQLREHGYRTPYYTCTKREAVRFCEDFVSRAGGKD